MDRTDRNATRRPVVVAILLSTALSHEINQRGDDIRRESDTIRPATTTAEERMRESDPVAGPTTGSAGPRGTGGGVETPSERR